MSLKIIIAGGRHYRLTPVDHQLLWDIGHRIGPITEVVSGNAPGTDRSGELWARKAGLKVTLFPARWREFGGRAGPIRNEQMAVYADAVVLFPGGRGTASMHRLAVKHKLRIFDFRDYNGVLL